MASPSLNAPGQRGVHLHARPGSRNGFGQSSRKNNRDLIVHVNEDGVRAGIDPIDSSSRVHTDLMKTQGLKQALDKHGFDAALGGARRDEEKSRAKERIFSLRSAGHRWDPGTSGPSPGTFSTR